MKRFFGWLVSIYTSNIWIIGWLMFMGITLFEIVGDIRKTPTDLGVDVLAYVFTGIISYFCWPIFLGFEIQRIVHF